MISYHLNHGLKPALLVLASLLSIFCELHLYKLTPHMHMHTRTNIRVSKKMGDPILIHTLTHAHTHTHLPKRTHTRTCTQTNARARLQKRTVHMHTYDIMSEIFEKGLG